MTDNSTFTELSTEQLALGDADVILYSSYGEQDRSGELEVVAGPLWQSLGAVQARRAYPVEDDVFYTGIGLRAANLQLDRLEELLG